MRPESLVQELASFVSQMRLTIINYAVWHRWLPLCQRTPSHGKPQILSAAGGHEAWEGAACGRAGGLVDSAALGRDLRLGQVGRIVPLRLFVTVI
jgi:hypothetical protein